MSTHAFNQSHACFDCMQHRVSDFDKSLTLPCHNNNTQFIKTFNVFFSDEKSFVIDKKDARRRCFRKVNIRFEHQNIYHYETKRSIMILAAIRADVIVTLSDFMEM